MRIVIPLLILLAMMSRCPGTYAVSTAWTPELNDKLLGIYFQTLPSNRFQEDRMKIQWLAQVPDHKNNALWKLQKQALTVLRQKNAIWKGRSDAERNQLEERLTRILEINGPKLNSEERLFDELRKQHPEYNSDPMLIRTVVHQWYKFNALRLRGELRADDVKWTPERIADLLYIARAERYGAGTIDERIKLRWSQMHPELNVNATTLLGKVRYLRKHKYQLSQANSEIFGIFKDELKAMNNYKELMRHLVSKFDVRGINGREKKLQLGNNSESLSPKVLDSGERTILKEWNDENESTISNRSADQIREQHNKNDTKSTAQFLFGHEIKQQNMIADRVLASHYQNEKLSNASKGKHLFNLNEPYHQFGLDGSSN